MLFRNQEGYFDPTAGTAILNAGKKERKMADMQINPFEIWEIKTPSGAYRDVLTIATNGKAVSILNLVENNFDGAIEITTKSGKAYTDICRIQYFFEDNFIEFKKSITDAEISDIKEGLAELFGIKGIDEKEPEVIEVPKYIEKIVEVPSENNLELVKAQAERDVFKKLYEDLVNSFVKGGK